MIFVDGRCLKEGGVYSHVPVTSSTQLLFSQQNYYQQQNTHTIKIIDTNEFLLIRPSRDSNLNIDVRIVTQAHSYEFLTLDLILNKIQYYANPNKLNNFAPHRYFLAFWSNSHTL